MVALAAVSDGSRDSLFEAAGWMAGLRETPGHLGHGGGRCESGVGVCLLGGGSGHRPGRVATGGQSPLSLVVQTTAGAGSRTFTPGRRRLVGIKLKFGLLGIAAIAGVIGVLVAGLVAFKYFGHQRRTLPTLIAAYVLWSAILTLLATSAFA